MKILSNKDVIFQNRKELTVISDIDYFLKGQLPVVKKLMVKCLRDYGKPGNITNLHTCIREYPEIPFFHHELIDEYEDKKEFALVEKHSILFYQKFPDAFFAKLHMGKIYGLKGQKAKIRSLFSKTLSLETAFPGKTTYAISEIVNFLLFRVTFYLSVGELEAAIETELKLAELIPNDPAHLDAQKRISVYKSKNFNQKPLSVNLTKDRTLVYEDFNLSKSQVNLLEDFYTRFYKLTAPDANFLVEVQIQADKNPEVAYFKEIICEYYQYFNESEAFEEAVYALNETHPDFLMGKLRMTQMLLPYLVLKIDVEEAVEKITTLFSKTFDFAEESIHRTVFLNFEYVYFQFTALHEWIEKGDFARADTCYKEILKVPNTEHVAKESEQTITAYLDALASKNLN